MRCAAERFEQLERYSLALQRYSLALQPGGAAWRPVLL